MVFNIFFYRVSITVKKNSNTVKQEEYKKAKEKLLNRKAQYHNLY